jgi:hypothetical protein
MLFVTYLLRALRQCVERHESKGYNSQATCWCSRQTSLKRQQRLPRGTLTLGAHSHITHIRTLLAAKETHLDCEATLTRSLLDELTQIGLLWIVARSYQQLLPHLRSHIPPHTGGPVCYDEENVPSTAELGSADWFKTGLQSETLHSRMTHQLHLCCDITIAYPGG